MAIPEAVSLYPHIVCRPGVVGGEPTIVGTRIPVRSIVLVFQEVGDVERVAAEYPRLTPSLVHEALDYYRDHQAEIDRAIAENLTDS